VERVCLLFSIRPGTGPEFDRRHREAWPELVPALREAGFHNYTLFRRDTEVVAYGECEPDASTCFEAMNRADVFRRWGEWFVPEIMPEPAVEAGGAAAPVPEIWHFD
jgi:L-rhamnose mutarotase